MRKYWSLIWYRKYISIVIFPLLALDHALHISLCCNGKANYNNRCSSDFSALDGFFSNLLRSLIPFMQAMNRNDFPALP